MDIKEVERLIREKEEIARKLHQYKLFNDKIEEFSNFKEALKKGLTVCKIETSGTFGKQIEVPWTLTGKIKDVIIEEIDKNIDEYKMKIEKM